ncbi:hypothetical protein PTKIN_Ptkin11bG0088600 [Pterospermum kingtungense]
MSVPQFGGWNQKAPGTTNYSMVFSRAQANRKEHKTDVRRSLGNEQDFIVASLPQPQQRQEVEDSVSALMPMYTSLFPAMHALSAL